MTQKNQISGHEYSNEDYLDDTMPLVGMDDVLHHEGDIASGLEYNEGTRGYSPINKKNSLENLNYWDVPDKKFTSYEIRDIIEFHKPTGKFQLLERFQEPFGRADYTSIATDLALDDCETITEFFPHVKFLR